MIVTARRRGSTRIDELVTISGDRIAFNRITNDHDSLGRERSVVFSSCYLIYTHTREILLITPTQARRLSDAQPAAVVFSRELERVSMECDVISSASLFSLLRVEHGPTLIAYCRARFAYVFNRTKRTKRENELR